MMTNETIDRLIKNCDRLQNVTIYKEGYMHTSCRAFDACMRTFDDPAANAITFQVFFNTPVLLPGYAKFYRDGDMVLFTDLNMEPKRPDEY